MEWNFEEAVCYYRGQGAPADQLALKNLLAEVQAENGGKIPRWALARIADALGIRESFLLAIIKRTPSLRADTEGHLLELCGGSGCSKRAKLARFVEQTYGREPAGFSVKVTPCMHLCGQGPVIRWDGETHCCADEALIRSLVENAGGSGKKP